MIYLYVKTHRKTGLKYLGKTISKDPYNYPGSGTRWSNHLNVHGKDSETIILLATNDISELKETGIFFSKLWNVVESDEWANLKPEEGDGGWSHINENRDEFYTKSIGVSNPSKLDFVKNRISMSNKLSSEENVRKRKANSISKYGVDHYSKNAGALEKRNRMLFDRYGVNNVSQLDSVKDKMIKKRNSQEFKDKVYITCNYCNKMIDPGNYNRWHGEKCKLNKVNGQAFGA